MNQDILSIGKIFLQTESTLRGVVMLAFGFPLAPVYCLPTTSMSGFHAIFLILFYLRTPCEVTGVVLRGLKRWVSLAGAGALGVWAMCSCNIPSAVQTESHWHHFYSICSASVHNSFIASCIYGHLFIDGQNHLLFHSPIFIFFQGLVGRKQLFLMKKTAIC